MNVLSLFDGISCGQIALNRANIKYDNYFASEIDKFAIKVTQHNYPNTIQLGDVTKILAKDLPKIDLLIGGSPCQGFSKEGKGLNFNDPRSKLFFEYVRLLKECKPKYFLLENVKMKKEYRDIITHCLNVEPIEINSNLVSAQNRQRIYWTNAKIDNLPKNKGIKLSSILDNQGPYHYYKDWQVQKLINKEYKRKEYYIIEKIDSKCRCLMANHGNVNKNKIWDDGKLRWLTPLEWERLQTIPNNYTDILSRQRRYQCIGNAWTVDIIAHIFSFMKF
jgi:site-specific DNA-cytosine methylase